MYRRWIVNAATSVADGLAASAGIGTTECAGGDGADAKDTMEAAGHRPTTRACLTGTGQGGRAPAATVAAARPTPATTSALKRASLLVLALLAADTTRNQTQTRCKSAAKWSETPVARHPTAAEMNLRPFR